MVESSVLILCRAVLSANLENYYAYALVHTLIEHSNYKRDEATTTIVPELLHLPGYIQ